MFHSKMLNYALILFLTHYLFQKSAEVTSRTSNDSPLPMETDDNYIEHHSALDEPQMQLINNTPSTSIVFPRGDGRSNESCLFEEK